jgi:uncharacterized membrane protein
LVLIFVFFPFFTGGIWIKRPHLFIELTDVGLSVGVVGLLALILKIFLNTPIEESWTLSVVKSAWSAWGQELEKAPHRTLAVASGLTAVLWSASSLIRHETLNSHAFDLGIFTNAVWNIVHGYGPFSSVKGGISLLIDHQSPLLMASAPFFYLFPHAETLLVVQALGLAVGAIPLFYLGRQYKTGAWTAALPILYWWWLPLRNANAFEFHPEVFMLPLFLCAIVGLQSTRRVSRFWGVLAFLFALGAKESAGAVACGVGVGWFLGAGPGETRAFTRKLGIAVALVGVATFVFDVKIVPRFFGVEYAYQDMYSQYGGGVGNILIAPFLKPDLFIEQIFGPQRPKFLFWTLAPLGFLPLLNPRAFFAAIPGYLMLFLSVGEHRVNLDYHYAIEPAVGLFWALPGGCVAFVQWSQRFAPERKSMALFALLFLMAATSGRGELTRMRRNIAYPHTDWIVSKFIPCVEPALSLSASEVLVPHLASRHWVHALDSIVDDIPKPVACVIEDRSIGNFPMMAGDYEQLGKSLKALGYHSAYSCGELHVFAQPGAECLRCHPECPELE